MIPKIIHYCWFGTKKMPKDQERFVNSWKKLMPDYTFKCWSEKDIDIASIPFAKEAYEAGKYAYVADYARIYALYNEGGIYMDTDVELNTRFDKFLEYGVFTSYEFTPSRTQISIIRNMITSEGERLEKGILNRIPATGLFSALIGAEKGHPFMRDCMEYYDKHSFNDIYGQHLTVPNILAFFAEAYGFKYKNQNQLLSNNMMIYDNKVFASHLVADKKSLAIHHCAASWVDMSFRERLKNQLYSYRFIRNVINALFPKNGL